MNIVQSRLRMIDYFERKRVFPALYFLFVLLFFISPNLHWYFNVFYVIMPLYLISLGRLKLKAFIHSKIWLMALILLFYMLLTVLWQINPGDDGLMYYLRKAIYLFVFLSLTMELTAGYPRFMERLFMLFCWIGALTAVISLFLFYSRAPFPSARLEYLADQFRNPILGAIIYGMTLLVIYFHILKKTSKKSHRWLYVIFMVIISGSILLTQSRGPTAILLGAFITGGLLTRDKKLLITLACIIVIIGAALIFNVRQVEKAITDRGISYRIELLEKTLSMIRGHVLFGKGITTEQDIVSDDGLHLHHPHNVYLATVLYGGLVGLSLLLIMLAAAFRESLNYFFLTRDITLFVLILFGSCTIITSQDKIITHPHPLWFSFWLPLGLTAGVSLKARKKI